ncbi:Hsp20/alpha crystallin family protein [Sediminibacillus halophilus]|uniref:HSP20 family protein n=1 Tax=Sediminibacillus halophilus TaxID=482461 RepID=A0A1G9V1T2_9BACI|nr:Hsp20/alpha crystallin family protein [Sediminibacillus halophilus]SDM66184.1 HSP20 family protein [Sediminibacillus halophilus]
MDPFRNMGEWKRNMDHFFGDSFWNEFEGVLKPPLPQINLYKKDKEVVCIASLPGVSNLKNIDIFVHHATLEIRGSIDMKEAEGQVVREEILHGSFERKIDLPYPVRREKVDASYQRGLLVIRLHRLMKNDDKKTRLEIVDMEE